MYRLFKYFPPPFSVLLHLHLLSLHRQLSHPHQWASLPQPLHHLHPLPQHLHPTYNSPSHNSSICSSSTRTDPNTFVSSPLLHPMFLTFHLMKSIRYHFGCRQNILFCYASLEIFSSQPHSNDLILHRF